MTIIYAIPAVRNAWGDTAVSYNPVTKVGDIADPGNAVVSAGWLQSSTPPPRQYFNWALNWTGQAIRYLMQNGLVDWQSGELYQTGAIVVFNNLVFQSLANNNTGNSPPATLVGNASWGPLAGYATIAMLAPFVTTAVLLTTLAAYAALNSPTFVGAPLAPTPVTADSSTKIANTAFVHAAINAALGPFLTSASAAAIYLTIANAAATYLTQANAAATYLTQTAAASTYATRAFALGQSSQQVNFVWDIAPNGTMTLSGVTPSLNGGANTIIFPKAFAVRCVSVNCQPIGNSASWAVTSITATQFTMNTGAAEPYYYIARGF